MSVVARGGEGPQALSGLHDSRMERAGRRAAQSRSRDAQALRGRSSAEATSFSGHGNMRLGLAPAARHLARSVRACPSHGEQRRVPRESVIGAASAAHAPGRRRAWLERRAALVKLAEYPGGSRAVAHFAKFNREAGATMDPTLMLPPATCISEQRRKGASAGLLYPRVGPGAS